MVVDHTCRMPSLHCAAVKQHEVTSDWAGQSNDVKQCKVNPHFTRSAGCRQAPATLPQGLRFGTGLFQLFRIAESATVRSSQFVWPSVHTSIIIIICATGDQCVHDVLAEGVQGMMH
jgi:hypothetical protein